MLSISVNGLSSLDLTDPGVPTFGDEMPLVGDKDLARSVEIYQSHHLRHHDLMGLPLPSSPGQWDGEHVH